MPRITAIRHLELAAHYFRLAQETTGEAQKAFASLHAYHTRRANAS